MSTDIRRTIIIGLGEQGRQIVGAAQTRLLRRYNGLPIVRTLAMVEGDLDEQPSSDPSTTILLPLTLRPERQEGRSDPLLTPWLPDIPEIDLSYRAGVRVALLDLEPTLRRIMVEQIKDLLHPRMQLLMQERDLRIAPPDKKHMDLYVVGNLGDNFASGLFVDLLYLLKQITDLEAADNVLFQLHAVLLLPELLPSWRESDDEWQQWSQANAYAALLELDRHMDSHPYRLTYPSGQTIEFSLPPVEPGSCYLVGDTNERIDAISSTDAVELTAEWLGHIVTAPIHSSLAGNFQVQRYGPHQALAAYGSFGLASLILPLQYIQDYCARRLTRDLAHALHTTLPAEESAEQTLLDFRRSPVLPDGGSFRRRLLQGGDESERQYAMDVNAYQAISAVEALKLEQMLNRNYDHRRGTVLPEIKRRVQGNKNQLAKEIEQHLHSYTRQIFDDDPPLALTRAIQYYEELISFLRARTATLEQTIRAESQRPYGKLLKEARGRYFNAAETFGLLMRWPPLVILVAMLLLFAWIYYVLGQMNDRYDFAYAIIGSGTLLSLLLIWGTRAWLGASRTNFIRLYDNRLKSQREIEEAQLEKELVDLVTGWATDIQQQLVEFRSKIGSLGRMAAQRLDTEHGHDRSWQEILYGSPYFSLEASIIEPSDLEQYYREVHGLTPSDFARHFTQLFDGQYRGAYSAWLTSAPSTTVAEFWQTLFRYATEQAKRLEKHYIVEKLEEKFTAERIRTDIEKMQRFAQPYLRTLMRGDLGEEAPPETAVAVHFEGQEENPEGSKTAKALADQQLLGYVARIGERERLTVAMIRRGLPLFVLPDVVKYATSYQQWGQPDFLHTARSHLETSARGEQRPSVALLEPQQSFLGPHQTFFLALAFRTFALPEAPFDTILYHTEAEAETQAISPPRAGYYHRYITPRERQRAEQFNRAPNPTWYFLGGTKREAAEAFFTYAQREEVRADVQNYIQQVQPGKVAHLLDTYLQQHRASVSATTPSPLEEREAQELDNALDSLMGQPHPSPVQRPTP